MSKLTESFRSIGVFNAYEFAGHGMVFLDYRGWDSVTRVTSSWFVVRHGFVTDAKAHWSDNGCKTFPGRKNSTALYEAKAWAGEKYGITEWAKTPYGTWMEAAFVKRRVKELKAEVKRKAGV